MLMIMVMGWVRANVKVRFRVGADDKAEEAGGASAVRDWGPTANVWAVWLGSGLGSGSGSG